MQTITIILVTLVSLASCLEYTDLENLGASCPLRDSCRQIPSSSNFTHRSCECDRLCSVFRDCCIDADVPLTPRRYRNARMHCMTFGSEVDVGVYAVDRCPRNFVGSNVLRSKCETEDDFSDPMVSVPVTETLMGVTFKNRYCAECNSASPAALISWKIFLSCETLSTYDIEDSYIMERLEYRASEKSWGVNYENEFHLCELVFDKPAHLRSGVRFCRTNLTSSCPESYSRRSIIQACQSYTAVLYSDNGASYKNVHCAICNGQRTNGLYCIQGWLSNRGNKPFSFALLLDVNRSDGDIVGESNRCSRSHKWDPFFKKCRELVCALPGFKMVNGKCKKSK